MFLHRLCGIAVAAALGLLTACTRGQAAEPAAQYRLVPAFPALTFSEPLDLQLALDDSRRFFVVEKDGRIKIFPNTSGAKEAALFLDISDTVYAKGEGGLLGMAFHPGFRTNRQFFTYYTVGKPRRVRVSRWLAAQDDPNRADPASEQVVLEVPYPDRYSNHNAGAIAFGPVDGMLYLGMGDGGGGGDPFGNGQNLRSLLGKILRIDVDHPQARRPYAIPADNPYVKKIRDARGEIWAYGLRNPWRMSFDTPKPGTQQLWVADVGQDEIEEVDLVAPGHNYGWNTMEGSHCFSPPEGCDTRGLALPVAEYDHSQGRSIIGGMVYRGRILPGLAGRYLFGDFISGRVWALDAEAGGRRLSPLTEITRLKGRVPGIGQMGIVSFGRDERGEVYAVDHIAGRILRLEAISEPGR